MTATDMRTLADDISLTEALRADVPHRIEELLREYGTNVPGWITREAATAVGGRGDSLQFTGHGERNARSQTRVANMFNHLSRGLAALAILCPDGATFAGLHWCIAEHDDCPRSR